MIYIPEEEFKQLGLTNSKPMKKKSEKKSKYHSRKTKVDGFTFDSTKEAEFYCKLKLMTKAKKIKGFCRQARFVIVEGQNGEKGSEYVTDFIIFYNDGTYEIIDVKGMETQVFKLKMKAFSEKYPKLDITILKEKS
jgi:hypothetical protein